MDKETTRINLYNSHIEFGVRILLLLRESTKPLSHQQLIYLDYFFIHLGDLDQNQDSLHPDIPYRSGEILVKRKVVKEAIDLMVTREMIGVKFENGNLLYVLTPIGGTFLSFLTNPYFKDLERASQDLFKTITDFSEEKLKSLVKEKYSVWGAEFTNDSLLEDFSL